MVEVIIFALIAFIVFKKLFSVLGDTSYDREISQEEKSKLEEFKQSVAEIMRSKEDQAKQIEIASGYEASLEPEDREVLDVIRQHEPGFNSEKFLKGCRAAFEMVISAFAEGNKPVLEKLLDKEILGGFVAEIDKNTANNYVNNITLVAITRSEIVSTSLEEDKSVAIIDVRITSEQIKVVKDKVSGNIVGGNAGKIQRLDEVWSFKRNLLARNNIWKLVSVSPYDEE